MGREGEWSSSPAGSQTSYYAPPPPPMQQQPYQQGMQYPPGSSARGGPPQQFAGSPQFRGPPFQGPVAAPPPPRFSGAASQFSGSGVQPSSGAAAGNANFRPPGPPPSGPPPLPPTSSNAVPPSSGRNYGPSAGAAFRPPPTSNMVRGPSGPPPGYAGPGLYAPPASDPAGAPAFSQPQFSSPMFHPSRPAPSPPTASSPYSQGPPPPHGAPPQGPRIQGPSSGSFSSPFSQPFRPVTGPPHSQVPNQIANQGSSPYMQQPHSQASMPPIPGDPPQQMHTSGQPHVPGNAAPGIQGMSQPGSPAGNQPGSANSRIDPNQIPRPQPTVTPVTYVTRVENQSNVPPSATSSFIVRDTGNCSPRMMRCTLNMIPCSGDLLSTSGMPLALMVQPLALDPAEELIQVVDFGDSGPVRCAAPQCRGYINPFMKFIDQGHRFICNLCGHTSETPPAYQCNLGPDGRRRDVDSRPELSRGTVEFVAPKEYQVRPPMPPVFFFLIDVSMAAVSTGAVAAACSAVNRALADLTENPLTRVGIATFDSTIHFYNLNKHLQTPSMLVVPDIQDVYTPLQNNLIVPLSEGHEHLEQLLETIPSMFQNNRIQESAFGAAVKGAHLALKSTGGKLLVFQTVLPSVGLGALTAREAEGKTGDKEAQKLIQPADKTLKTMAIEFSESQVCADLFLTSQNYLDIASLSVVPRTTGGQIYFYHGFQSSVDSAKLYNDLRWNLTRPQGLEAIMRVRCSKGLQLQEYYGNFWKRNPTEVELPAIDCDKTIMVTFKHDDKFQDGSECSFQSALLYTTMNGQRRIRINTLSLSCTTALSNLFRGADLDTQFTYLLKNAAQDVLATPVVQVRDRIVGQCVTILYTYRKFCATASSSGQLILPEALKLLPLYTMALVKSVGLRSEVRVDERSYWLNRVASLSASLAIPLVYPRMFALHNLPTKEELGGAILPKVVPLSSENLDQDGIFLLENGEDGFLYVGTQASPDIVHQLFGVQSAEEMVSGQFSLQENNNDLSRRLNEVVNEIRRQRCSYLRLRLLKRGDPSELLFFSYLVEDKSALGYSYVEFLVHVHRQIQNRMA
ncbi:unnamed protein product [Sphagnum jensenii]|uniref:Uncharacterized protein n=1 Tax=Sphagnum jensenii TaxID=128206 RepID=A0ABP1C2V6_9BRYO